MAKINLGFNSCSFFFFFFFFGWATNWAQSLNGARRLQRGRVWAPKKNPLSERAGFGPRVLAHGLGPGMKKPGLNPTVAIPTHDKHKNLGNV